MESDVRDGGDSAIFIIPCADVAWAKGFDFFRVGGPARGGRYQSPVAGEKNDEPITRGNCEVFNQIGAKSGDDISARCLGVDESKYVGFGNMELRGNIGRKQVNVVDAALEWGNTLVLVLETSIKRCLIAQIQTYVVDTNEKKKCARSIRIVNSVDGKTGASYSPNLFGTFLVHG